MLKCNIVQTLTCCAQDMLEHHSIFVLLKPV